MTAQKLRYAVELAVKRLKHQGLVCPDCGSRSFTRLDSKFCLASLRRCHSCRLIYRAPTDSHSENIDFYQDDYSEGFTTSLPDDEALARMTAAKFAGSEKDYSHNIAMLTALGLAPGARVLDYGCSWGYGSWQLARAGFDVVAVEVSRPRAQYARDKLGVNVRTALPEEGIIDALGQFDCVFSSHVLEHLPRPSDLFGLARKVLRPGGLLFTLTPNGSLEYRAENPRSWHSMWGKVHPHMIDPDFYVHALGEGIFLGSTPVSLGGLRAFVSRAEPVREPLTRSSELLCVARI